MYRADLEKPCTSGPTMHGWQKTAIFKEAKPCTDFYKPGPKGANHARMGVFR